MISRDFVVVVVVVVDFDGGFFLAMVDCVNSWIGEILMSSLICGNPMDPPQSGPPPQFFLLRQSDPSNTHVRALPNNIAINNEITT